MPYGDYAARAVASQTTRPWSGRILCWLADGRNSNSPSARLRRRRIQLFSHILASLPAPINILDVGGSIVFWQALGFRPDSESSITILNLEHLEDPQPGFLLVQGDGRDLSRFSDRHFDVVFSNSTIEHVGTFQDQQRMASEVMRVGRIYFIQTPSRHFPIEQHFLFPCFQFLPRCVQLWLMTHMALGWFPKYTDPTSALAVLDKLRLLTSTDLVRLFPDAVLHRERLWGRTKSFVAIGPTCLVGRVLARIAVFDRVRTSG